MDRFRVLFEIYSENLNEFNKYQKESLNFFTQYLESFIEYFSIIRENMLLFSWDEKNSPTSEPEKAMQLQSDSFWHVRMGIKLWVKESQLPEQNLLFEMSFKKFRGSYIMKLGKGVPIEIPYSNGTWHHYEFLKHVYEYLVDYYQNDLNKFLDRPESNRLGFDYGLKD